MVPEVIRCRTEDDRRSAVHDVEPDEVGSIGEAVIVSILIPINLSGLPCVEHHRPGKIV